MLKHYLELPRSVHVLCVGTFINRAGSFLIIFLTLYLKKELDLSVEFATRTIAAFGIGSIVAALVGGHLADAIGRRTVMLLSLSGGAGVLVIFAFLRTPLAIMSATFLFAAVMDMYRPAASAMIADLVEPEHRTHAFGLMYVSINLGFSVAPVVGGVVAQYSFQWLFWGDAATSFIYAVIIFFAIRETLPSRQMKSDASDDPQAEAEPIVESNAPVVTVTEAVVRIVKDRTFMIFCLASLCGGLVYQQAFSTFPLYLSDLGIGEKTYGRIIALNGIMIVFLQLPFTAWFGRFNKATLLATAAVVVAVGFGLIGAASTAWQFALTVVVWTCGEMLEAPVKFALAADLAPKELRARYMGVISMSYSAALAIGATLGGVVLARWGGSYIWQGCFFVGLLAAALYLIIRKQLAQASPPA